MMTTKDLIAEQTLHLYCHVYQIQEPQNRQGVEKTLVKYWEVFLFIYMFYVH
jgi:hypothetical protein